MNRTQLDTLPSSNRGCDLSDSLVRKASKAIALAGVGYGTITDEAIAGRSDVGLSGVMPTRHPQGLQSNADPHREARRRENG